MSPDQHAGTADRILAVNCGSSSVKFALYTAAGATEELRYDGLIERIGQPAPLFTVSDGSGSPPVESREVPARNHSEALNFLLDWLGNRPGSELPTAAGHRVVHGGRFYDQPQLITSDVVDTLERLAPLAPLHIPIELAAIQAIQVRHPALPQVACFDTAFHRTMPRVAQLFGLPRRYLDAGVLRYGFHGLSYEYIVSELKRESAGIGQPVFPERLIIAHLGNGASMVAVRDGRSIDTTMGLTPIGGLVMSTRSGDIDPGILLYLSDTDHLAPSDLRRAVERDGGLLGVSESSSDMQDLLARQDADQRAAEAVELFAYTARKHLGALAAALGGLDCLIFTAGIGEHSAPVRQGICDGLGHMGISLDPERNAGGAAVISTPNSPVTVRVITTNEELMIARHTRRVVERRGPESGQQPDNDPDAESVP